ncbi:UDP-glucosyl transferase 73B3 [Prunus dulcis]|uniref:Glycosyltransferase n=1 Tax=Prunus dulcis TaxID=3755 RepID=A0A4Y1RVF7_PRUDU|nr:UDP-glucosyl transferase 73B3 [Prunus dulcis]
MYRLFAQQGIIVTIFTTPHNAARFQAVLTRDIESGLQIRIIQMKFPAEEVGWPEGCENFDMLPSPNLVVNLSAATTLLHKPVEKLFEELTPKPNCIISDMCLTWTTSIASKYHIPRISFSGRGCFCDLCVHNLRVSNVLESVTSDSEYLVLPDLPDRIEMTKAQLPEGTVTARPKDFRDKIIAAETETYGMIMNTFEELEPAYVQAYKVTKDKLWCIGPASLCNKDDLDKAQRVCVILSSEQLIEIGLALEVSNKPFIWVVRGCNETQELEKWIAESGFEERNKARSLVIRGWAPQTLILSHPAVGGFLTHCGWNSTLEGICAGVPLLTWPMFGDQFLNEKLVEQILKIAVRVGVEFPVKWGEEEKIRVVVRKEKVKEAIEKLMDGEESQGRRERARELAEMAKIAIAEGGSSDLNIKQLIQEIKELTA